MIDLTLPTAEAGEKEERAGGQAEQQPQEARPQAVTPCEDAGGSGAQPVPPSILPDLIRFLDEHPEHDTTATAGRVMPMLPRTIIDAQYSSGHQKKLPLGMVFERCKGKGNMGHAADALSCA